MNKPRILVTGALGQLGQSLGRLGPTSNADFVFASHHDLDIADPQAVIAYFARHTFHFCINTAAYTKVDLAEQEQEQAHRINAVAPGVLAKSCHEQGCTFIHISSDYVYHNGITRPLKEDDPVSPVSVYARTKLHGEQAALLANPRTVILRTSWLFSEYGNNFVKTITRLITSGKPLRIVNDQTGCPTYAGNLAQAILVILRALSEDDSRDEMYGVFNYCNEGAATWYDFAREIASSLGINADITPVSTAVYGAPASRPPYSVLDTGKIKKMFQVSTPHWREGLHEVLRKISK